jgi:hypothetical protein
VSITMGEHPVGITRTSPTKAAFPPSLSAIMALAHDSRAVSRIRPFHHPLRRRWAQANTTHLLGCWHGAVGVCSAGYAAAGVNSRLRVAWVDTPWAFDNPTPVIEIVDPTQCQCDNSSMVCRT